MNRIFTQLLSLVALGLLLFSCSSDKPEPANVIEDPQGVTIRLTWTVNGGQATVAPADLDLFLMQGTAESDFTFAAASRGLNPEESILFRDTMADGSHAVQVGYSTGTGRADYKVDITGVSTRKAQSFSGSFEASEKGTHFNLVRIVKAGHSYRVEKFSSN